MGLDLTLAYHPHPHSGHATPVTEPTPPPLDSAPFGDPAGASFPPPPPLDSDDSQRYASSGPASPASIRGGHPLRYNPLATPSPAGSSSSSTRRRSVDEAASYSDDEPLSLPPHTTRSIGESMSMNRKEVTRRQRIEAEQRRRDELRDGYSRLREVLPSASHRGSKVALLDRGASFASASDRFVSRSERPAASSYIVQLEGSNTSMHQRLHEMELEVQRLRKLNEIIATNLAGGGPISAAHTPVMASPADTASLHSDMGHLHVDDGGVDPTEIMPPLPKDEALSPA